MCHGWRTTTTTTQLALSSTISATSFCFDAPYYHLRSRQHRRPSVVLVYQAASPQHNSVHKHGVDVSILLILVVATVALSECWLSQRAYRPWLLKMKPADYIGTPLEARVCDTLTSRPRGNKMHNLALQVFLMSVEPIWKELSNDMERKTKLDNHEDSHCLGQETAGSRQMIHQNRRGQKAISFQRL